MKKLLSLLLVLVMALSLVACGGNSGGGNQGSGNSSGSSSSSNSGSSGSGEVAPPAPSNDGEPIKDIVLWESSGTRELEGFFMLNTEKAADLNVLCNAYSALLEINNKGQLQPAVAKEWGSDDGGLTWTFKLRDDVVWADYNGNEMAKCTAQDWVTAMEWVLNFHKNGANNTSMPCTLIAGAQEYYDYTKELSEAEGLALKADGKFAEMVGVKAPDDYTLIYTCTKNAPYFETLCTSACLYPVSQAQIDEKGVENMISMSNETMWYNGAYIIDTYIQNNEKVLVPNPLYWDKEASLFDSVTIRMIADGNTDDQLYETGEVDQCDLNESNLRKIWEDEGHEFHDQLVEKRPRKYSYQIHFNFDKNNEDGTPDTNWNTAIANEAFRKAMYYGLDLTNYWARTNFIYPTHCENLAYTMKGLLYFSDGTDYVDKVIEQLGIPETEDGVPRRYNPTEAAKYVAQAKEELAAKGVTFPVEIDYYILSGSQSALDTATVLKEIFEGVGGADFITLKIGEYVSSNTQEVINPSLHSIAINGWGADYGDPENFVGQELYGNDSAYYSMNYSNINDATDPDLIAAYKEFTALADVASNIFDNNDDRYQAYVDAEVCMLEHALVIPAQYEVSWQLTRVNDYSKMEAMYGAQNYTYKNWETSTVPYTSADYEGFRAAFNG